jgi:hypothetical protein
MTWRKKWKSNWHEVRHCSQRCRSRRLTPVDHMIERAISNRTLSAGHDKSICPSEAAMLVGHNDWKLLMPRVREAARRLAARGEIEILQRGRTVDPCRFRGPYRLRTAL